MELFRRILKSGVGWGMTGLGVRLLGSVALLGLATRYIPPDELGFWYLITSFIAMTSVLDLGITRTAAYKVAHLLSEVEREDSAAKREQAAVLIGSLRMIYLLLTVISFVGLSLAGGWWIWMRSVGPHADAIRVAWLVTCPAFALVVISNYSRVIFYATNRLNVFQFLSTLAFALQAVIGVGGILAGYTIHALVAANLAMFAVLATGALVVGYWPGKLALLGMTARGNPTVSRDLLKQSLGTFCNSLTSYVVINANVLIASRFVPLSEIASYGLTMQVTMICSQLSATWIDVKQPLFVHWAHTEPEKLRTVFVTRMRLALFTYVTTVVAAMTIGPLLLGTIGAHTHFLPAALFAALAIFQLVFMHYTQFEFVSLCLGDNPFIPSYLISAAIGVVLAVGLASVIGIWGVILGPLAAQLAWNSWWVPLHGLRKLQLAPSDYLRRLVTIRTWSDLMP